ncbi:diaminopimelate decarboxylase [Tamaricihabitans halophyticus]|uniref:Diaminopimelate decarboxylase n=1 Tax=Tamaricihabitans halophyticus TaxID=1262583 RepID=A0A4R2Q8C7_9PSEU|nr:diaminopimelate decarboxylase [Tamaricihabitans halophyticus]TCP45067.1 diaminopimelate decarboxylase [Tamaricihabitans halophyticus]
MKSDTHMRADRVAQAVRAAVEADLVGPEAPVAGFIDVDGVRSTVRDLRTAFEASPVLHAFAAKACPLVPVLRLLADEGLGCEVASAGELAQAVAAGFPAERIVLDAPAKTQAELWEALERGVAVNADNLDELKRLDALVTPDTVSVLGVRVNPQVGAGTIDAMSTASPSSKFGIPLNDPGCRDELLAAYAARPWLTRLHVHVGSQGCPLELIADGIHAVYQLAEEINANAGRQQVTSIDIGGGLPVNFADDTVRPTFADYVAVLRDLVPGLFDGRYTLLTEFGRSLLAKNGFIIARVEYVKDVGGRRIAVTHAGAQTATRTVFMPQAWPLRVEAFDAEGRRKFDRPLSQDVAGPCCFAGDMVASGRELPELAEGDLVVLRDTGAYYFSTPFSYNSLPRLAVHGFRAAAAETVFAPIRSSQTVAEIVAESGAEHRDALRAG